MGPLPCAKPEGGRPPLADGCGIGDGECAGEGTRGLLAIGIGADGAGWEICGVLCVDAGESVMDPNCRPPFDPPTGPPFGIYPLGAFALMVTELFRLWLLEPPLTEALP